MNRMSSCKQYDREFKLEAVRLITDGWHPR